VLGHAHKSGGDYKALKDSRHTRYGRLQREAQALMTALNIDASRPCTLGDARQMAEHLRVRLVITDATRGLFAFHHHQPPVIYTLSAGHLIIADYEQTRRPTVHLSYDGEHFVYLSCATRFMGVQLCYACGKRYPKKGVSAVAVA
jgi:hypothetical protein